MLSSTVPTIIGSMSVHCKSDVLELPWAGGNKIISLYPYLNWPYKRIEEALKTFEGKVADRRQAE